MEITILKQRYLVSILLALASAACGQIEAAATLSVSTETAKV